MVELIIMEIRDLTYFIKLAETKSFAQTAQNFSITIPAISAMVKRLEKELGVPLIYKANNRASLSLTPAGVALYRHAKKIISLEIVSKREVIRASQHNFKLGFSDLASFYWLPSLLTRFADAHLLQKVITHQDSSPNLARQLRNGVYDAIIYSELVNRPSYPQIDGRVLKPYDIKFFVNANNPLAQHHFIDFHNLGNNTIITHHKRYLGQAALKLSFQEAHIQPNKNNLIFIDNLNTTLQLVARGVGIAYLIDAQNPLPKNVKVIPVLPKQRARLLLKIAIRPDIIPSPIQEQCLQVIHHFLNSFK